MKSGLFIVDKLPGVSSASIVGLLKRKFKLDKVGHAGTLDPFATGLLTILVGDATRLMDYFAGGEKIYDGEIFFGIQTDSNDITGNVLEKNDQIPDFEEIKKKSQELVGEIQQIPPQVSAVHVNGKRAYNLVKEGVQFELKAKKVTIKSFEIEQISPVLFRYKIRCSKGTYIRSIARDLGEKIGIPCVISTLNRSFSDPFSIEKAKKIDQITIDDMLAWEDFFPSQNLIQVDDFEFEKLRKGNLSSFEIDRSDEFLVYCNSSNEVGGVLKLENQKWKILFNCRS